MELCACYIAGSISRDQRKRLEKHLIGCDDCRRTLDEFQQIASMGLPALAPEFASSDQESSGDNDRTQHRLLSRIENDINSRKKVQAPVAVVKRTRTMGWRTLAPIAAGLLIAVSAALYSYRLGEHRGILAGQPQLNQAEAKAETLQMQMARSSSERGALLAKLTDSEAAINRLSAEVKARQDEIAALKIQQEALTASAASVEVRRVASDAQRADLNRKLGAEQASLDAAQRDLQSVRDARSADLVQMASLQRRVNEFDSVLKDRDQTIQQQKDLLAHDRDIRDLIGARDLYVAEVSDVGRDGQTNEPFGRVFYTKGKSLIFYAYNLDRQPGLRRASTFQAWGRRGPDFQQALPLGILYLDPGSNRRWILKFDDPKALERIDAVFVTVEPKGGSRKPSGKPLLFAYLKVEPNHP
ncbi:MAG: hypothetical protein ACRD3Q_21000 [Terriglobales bacterium]